MPSKSKSKSRSQGDGKAQARRVWDDDSTAELLAWLDYCRENKVDFRLTATDHLGAITGRSLDFDQIKSRLRLKWEQWGSDASGSVFRNIFDRGTDCLTRIPREEKERIRKARSRLRSSTASTGRSRSRTLETVQQDRESRRTPASPLTALTTTPELESSPGLSDSPLSALSATPELWAETEAERRDSFPASFTPLETLSSSGPVMEEAIESAASPSFPNLVPSNRPDEASADTRDSQDHDERLSLRDLENELKHKTNQLAEAEVALSTHRNQLFALYNELSEVRKEYIQLGNSVRATESQQDQMALLSILQRENSNLKQRLSSSKAYQDNMREIEEGMLGPTEGEIRGEMMTIEDNIDDAASSLRGACAPFRGERPNFSECSCTFFKTLTIKVGGWNDIDEFCTHVLDNEIPILEVLRSIAAAGICTLVFESTSLDFQLSGSPLLDQYRRHLLLRDGPALLRDLDFVAHKSLISHANFLNQIIPGKAKEIGNQVVEVLLPIIDSSTSHSGTEAPGVSPGAAKPLDPEDDGDVSPIEAFQGAIENALKLRAQMALNGLKQYEFVYIPPETYFNPQTMNLNGQNYDSEALVSLSRYQFLRPAQMSQRTPSGLGQKVKLCLFPALYSRRRPQFDPARSTEVDIGEILVQVRVFTEGRPDQDSEGDDLKLVTKAVVLV